jgi:protein SERAC1
MDTYNQFSILLALLVKAIEDEDIPDTLCILDALDECDKESRDSLVKSLTEYFSAAPKSVSISKARFKVILSRPDSHMERTPKLRGKDQALAQGPESEASAGVIANLEDGLISRADLIFL